MSNPFRALRVTEHPGDIFTREVVTRQLEDLAPGEVLIEVQYSSLNYKDALSATGNKGVTRQYPHTPGIDASGLVAASTHPGLELGDAVLVTGYDLGMNTDGGYSEYVRVPAAWVVRVPEDLDLYESMALGTAGFTAGLALYKLEQAGQRPDMGPIVVTGASGGVGCLAVGLLAKAGYEVIASTGKETAHAFLHQMGAARCEDRSFVQDFSDRPLIRTRWAGAVDTVGGLTLATLLKACGRDGSVAACGLVHSPLLDTTVYPFILNGVNLLGVDSATCPQDVRQEVWNRLATTWRLPAPDTYARTCTLDTLEPEIQAILRGEITGRVVVSLL
ncbi:MAG: YhdH/YhfP family quinone oxidoreductase [Bacteroidia bacterium]|nr:YhdH/YhfP family quinone oxidoreductase [Bacteroidia bacterium]